MDVATREWGLPLPYNPAKLVRRPSVANERNRRLTEGEEERLLVACDAGRNRLMKPLLISCPRDRDAAWRNPEPQMGGRRPAPPDRARTALQERRVPRGSSYPARNRDVRADVCLRNRLPTPSCFPLGRTLCAWRLKEYAGGPGSLICASTICAMRRFRGSSSAGYRCSKWQRFRDTENSGCCNATPTCARPTSWQSSTNWARDADSRPVAGWTRSPRKFAFRPSLWGLGRRRKFVQTLV